MKLTQTQESIVPELSVTDSWPQMQRKKCELTPQDTETVFDAEISNSIFSLDCD